MLKGKELGNAIKKAIELKLAAGSAKSKTEIAKHFGIRPPSIHDWMKKGSISKDKLPELWNYFSDVVGPEHWGLQNEPGKTFFTGVPVTVVEPGPDRKGNDFYVIPQYDTRGAMGNGLLLPDQPGVIQSWHVSKEWIKKNIKGHQSAKDLCIVTGFGDSMRPLFNPGDPLLIDISVNTVEFDTIYFFRVGNEGFIKRLQRIPGEGLRVLSANRDNYEPWTIKPDMDFQVLGRVLKVWRSDDF